jgi:hypothetical protein
MPDPLLGLRPSELFSSRGAERSSLLPLVPLLTLDGLSLPSRTGKKPEGIVAGTAYGFRRRRIERPEGHSVLPSPARGLRIAAPVPGMGNRCPGRSRSRSRSKAERRGGLARAAEAAGLLCPRDGPKEHPRLQGLPPRENPLLGVGGLGRRTARSSPGLLALQGVPPRGGVSDFSGTPLMGFSRGTFSARSEALQGLYRSEVGWSLSRLPTLLGFGASWPSRAFGSAAVRESPPRAPGCVAVPCRTFLEPLVAFPA